MKHTETYLEPETFNIEAETKKRTLKQYQYYCKKCFTTRQGLVDMPAGIGGYSWNCPECAKQGKPGMVWSYEVIEA